MLATCMFACIVVSEVLLSNPILLVVDFFSSTSESTVHHCIGYWVVQYLEYMMKTHRNSVHNEYFLFPCSGS